MNKSKPCVKNTNSTHLNWRSTMTKPKYTLRQAWEDGDIIVILIAIISIIITEFASCLTSQHSRSSIPSPTKHASQSMPTTCTSTSSTKTQRSSRSTKPTSGTADPKKEVGIGFKDTQSLPIASSPRGKQSKPTSTTLKSTKSKSSRASVSRQRSQTMTSALPVTTQSSTLQNDLSIADEQAIA